MDGHTTTSAPVTLSVLEKASWVLALEYRMYVDGLLPSGLVHWAMVI